MVIAALEMVVREYGAAHDRQIGVRAEHVVRKLIHEIALAHERIAADAHGRVLRVEYDAVLVVIQIRRILQKPLLSAQRQRNHAVILARREADAARVAGILAAEHAFGIAGLLRVLRGGDVARVLFGLGEIDRDFQPARGRFLKEARVFGDAVHADVVRIAACLIEAAHRCGGTVGLQGGEEACARFGGRGRERAHQLCREQVAALAGGLQNSGFHRTVQQVGKIGGRRFGRGLGRVFDRLGRVHMHDFEQAVDRVIAVERLHEVFLNRKVNQTIDRQSGVGHDENTLPWF